MDDPTRRAQAGLQADDAPELPVPEGQDVAARLDDLGTRLVLDEHRFWRVPEGWNEAELRDLARQLGMPLAVMAHLAVTAAQGAMPGDPTGWGARVPRFDFEARVESAELRRLRKAEHAVGKIAKPIYCRGRGRGRGCRRLIARPRLNPDAAGGVEFVLIGPVRCDPSTGTYVFGSGRPSRASDVYLAGFGPGHVDLEWKIDVRCSCGHPDTIFVGRALQQFARLV
jgi:hypothetical protein